MIVRCSVGIDQSPFFFFLAAAPLAFFAAGLLAFFAAGFAAFAATFFPAAFFAVPPALFFAAVFFVGVDSSSPASSAAAAERSRPERRAIFLPVLVRDRFTGSVGSCSATGSSVWPIADPSMSTTSDQRMWYVDASLNDIA